MPVLPAAHQRQPWVMNQISGTSIVKPRTAVTGFPQSLAPQSSRIPSLVAAAETEASSVSPTRQRPSNEVVGGAFIGAFLGFILLLLLVGCCRARGRGDGSTDSGSTDSSSISPPKGPLPTPKPGYNPKTPSYPKPVAQPAGRSKKSPQYYGPIMGTQFNGDSVLAIKRNRRRRHARDHGPAELDSISSPIPSDRRKEVCFSCFSLLQ